MDRVIVSLILLSSLVASVPVIYIIAAPPTYLAISTPVLIATVLDEGKSTAAPFTAKEVAHTAEDSTGMIIGGFVALLMMVVILSRSGRKEELEYYEEEFEG